MAQLDRRFRFHRKISSADKFTRTEMAGPGEGHPARNQPCSLTVRQCAVVWNSDKDKIGFFWGGLLVERPQFEPAIVTRRSRRHFRD